MSALATLAAVAGGGGGAGEKLGAIALVALVGVAVLARPPKLSDRVQAAAMLAALVLAPVLLAMDVWHSAEVTHLRHHPAAAAAAVAAAVVVVGALAVLFHRRPAAFPLAVVLTVPFRVPISVGGSTANLLVALYAVVAAGALARLAPRLLGRRAPGAGADRAGSAVAREGGVVRWLLSPRGLEWLAMTALVLYAVQATYSSDFSKALQNITFFYAPFALLFALLREVRWSRELLLRCLGVALALAVVFVAVGFAEHQREKLLLNPELREANEYSAFFRVNSVFFDPNIYGRYLALVMIMVATALLRAGSRRGVLAAAAALLWLWGGLFTSLSETSMVALLVGLVVLAAWRWHTLTTVSVTGAAGLLALVIVLLAPSSADLGLRGEGGSANNATAGRVNLVTGGLSLFSERPLQGFGSGSFAPEYRAHLRPGEHTAVSASHTIPITVAAEQGLVGLAVYVALLMSAFAVLFRGAGRSPPRAALAACFAALILHTWAYADFLEDPETWVLLGIGVALARAQGWHVAWRPDGDRAPAHVGVRPEPDGGAGRLGAAGERTGAGGRLVQS